MFNNIHYSLTHRIACEVGFSEADAEAIAVACRDLSFCFEGRKNIPEKLDFALGQWKEQSYEQGLSSLGKALHLLQDRFLHSPSQVTSIRLIFPKTCPSLAGRLLETEQAVSEATASVLKKFYQEASYTPHWRLKKKEPNGSRCRIM